ncbi:transglycosylase SLT domain-containing protein [Enterobacter chengduensis]|uniref:transglycosylase SLT domain-containing protein n=1 Tax=Enterobacter chengduensis TaxID=2494701 RepID=UPI0029285467|nr:transglycosylase SLT domain-containing protein [Enterobacter chengduensis]MDV0368792.1 transglycosylase SLT domain-containing protein [Enterobacter chengduensis]
MTETIRDYLVSLGFDIDSSGQAKFEATLKGVAANVVKLGAVVESSALAIVGFTTSIANGLDKLYWASQRTGATVNGIKALGYAASQTGSSAEAAQNSLESLARFMRSNPGAEGFLNRLGVQTRDASGQMRDMSAIFTGVGQRLSSMPYYRANQYAQMLGIDENTLMAMRRGMNGFSADYQSMLQKTGFNADKAAEQSNKFMTSMRGLTSLFGIMRDKIGANLAGGLAGSIDSLRRRILDNFPRIEDVTTRVVKGILWAGDTIGRVLWRTGQAIGEVMAWFEKLDPSGQQVISLFSAIGVAWRTLNAVFAMSPIGLIITAVTALAAAVLLLYDDFKTWKEGGESLIDWAKWKPAIDYAMKAFGDLGESILVVYGKAKELGGAILDVGEQLLKFLNIDTSKFNGKWLFDQIIESAKNAIKILGSMVDAIKKIIQGDFSGAFSSLKDAAITFTQGPVAQGAADLAKGAWEKLSGYLGFNEPEEPTSDSERHDVSEVIDHPEWLSWLPGTGKSGDEPEQHAQSVKRPQALEHAGTIAELVNNYARKSDQASNQHLISTLSREMGMAVDSKLLPSDIRDLLKVLRGIAQNINQPGSESATEIISSPQVINAEQLMPRPKASAQVPDYVDTIAKLVNNYAKNAGRADNRALIAELTRITGKSDDSKLLSSDMQDMLKVLRDIAQNTNQPGSESAADLLLPHPIIATEQPIQRPQASAKGKVLLDWMQPMFSRLESLYRLPEGLLKSVAITESGGNQFAVGPETKYGSAKGLFQLIDGTARDLGLRGNDVFDPMKSAEAAAKYLNQLLKQNGGDLSKTLASYNWGIGNVQRYGMELMPQETRNYIPKVMSNMPGGNATTQIQQQNTYNIYGGNAQELGTEVGNRQESSNAMMMRLNQVRPG